MQVRSLARLHTDALQVPKSHWLSLMHGVPERMSHRRVASKRRLPPSIAPEPLGPRTLRPTVVPVSETNFPHLSVAVPAPVSSRPAARI
jgi:hypothetical protein